MDRLSFRWWWYPLAALASYSLFACSSREVEPRAANRDVHADHPTATSRDDALKPSQPSAGRAQPESAMLTPEKLGGLGFNLSKLSADQSLLCGRGEQCVCLRPLSCNGACPTPTSVVDTLVSALDHPTTGRTVRCALAESGRCNEFTYFTFRGDLGRDETHWFDSQGKLTATYSYSDHDAYCDRQTRVRVEGVLPDCLEVKRTELYCGDGRSPLPPLAALRHDVLSVAERVGTVMPTRQP